MSPGLNSIIIYTLQKCTITLKTYTTLELNGNNKQEIPFITDIKSIKKDEYNITSKIYIVTVVMRLELIFASSLVSLFYGEGDLKETIKIGTLAGWDSDNPTSTWGGLIGFIIGRKWLKKNLI